MTRRAGIRSSLLRDDRDRLVAGDGRSGERRSGGTVTIARAMPAEGELRSIRNYAPTRRQKLFAVKLPSAGIARGDRDLCRRTAFAGSAVAGDQPITIVSQQPTERIPRGVSFAITFKTRPARRRCASSTTSP